jgi:hypothetical protein
MGPTSPFGGNATLCKRYPPFLSQCGSSISTRRTTSERPCALGPKCENFLPKESYMKFEYLLNFQMTIELSGKSCNAIRGRERSVSTLLTCSCNFDDKYEVSSCLSFFLSAPTAAATVHIVSLLLTVHLRGKTHYYSYFRTLCILIAKFQHFILRFNKIWLLCRYLGKRG